MTRRQSTIERLERRVDELVEDFDDCLDAFDRRQLFTGPSIYFHLRTLETARHYRDIAGVLGDVRFFEHLYATLTAWGMRRMGPGGAKLVPFDDFMASIQRQAHAIEPLGAHVLGRADWGAERRWRRRCDLGRHRVNQGLGIRYRDRAGAKTLHHILPPIDRQYTLRFFFDRTTIGAGDERTFKDIFPYFNRIARQVPDVESRVRADSFHTSRTKVIDNAIVGDVLTRVLKK